MTTQHIGDEEANKNPSSDEETPETAPIMERSLTLTAPTPLNIDAADLYCEWKHWINAFDIYAIATELTTKDDSIQRATLLHCLGPAAQRIFSTLPGDNRKLDETKQALENYFAPKRNVVSEQYKFRSREQKPEESIDAYLSALRELAKSCDFGILEEEMIRDQIMEKCASKILREKLLHQEDLDLTKAMKQARIVESSKRDASLIAKGTKDDPIPIDQVSTARKPEQKFSCFRCGGVDGHSPSECGAINLKCNACCKIGHLARVCRSRPTRSSNQKLCNN